ncbi:hypothetical protein B0H14DRAFT_3472018 [Mycena olivaceomarginata]|nr:hypothetical protein B0H14DRAFT_3472018 [Mycena olivaceomarginata]
MLCIACMARMILNGPSPFNRGMDVLFGEDCRNADGRLHHVRRGASGMTLIVKYLEQVEWSAMACDIATIKLDRIIAELEFLCTGAAATKDGKVTVEESDAEDDKFFPDERSPSSDDEDKVSSNEARPSVISVEDLEAFLSSHARSPLPEAVPGTRSSPRHAQGLPIPAPIIPANVFLLNPPNSPKAAHPAARKSPIHRPAPQFKVNAVVGKGRNANSFDVLASLEDPSYGDSSGLPPDVTAATRADQRGQANASFCSPCDIEAVQCTGPSAISFPQASDYTYTGSSKEAAFREIADSSLTATSFDDLASILKRLTTLIRAR